MVRKASNPYVDKYAPVGTTMWCSYWHYAYKVLSHNDDGSITCEQVAHPNTSDSFVREIGKVWSHGTPVDRRDIVISEAV